MTELAIDPPGPCGYVVLWLGEVCEWDPDRLRLFAQEGKVTLFADQFSAECAIERTTQSMKRIDSAYVADRREWKISPVRRVRAKESSYEPERSRP